VAETASIGDELHFVGVVQDGRLWYTIRRANGTWFHLGDIRKEAGNESLRFVSALCASTDKDLQVAGVTNDGGLYHTLRSADGKWTPFGNVRTEIGDHGDAAYVFCAKSGKDFHLAYISTKGKIWGTVRKPDGHWKDAVDISSKDPDLPNPTDTTGGQIGLGIGLVIGTYFGDPVDGGIEGAVVGYGLDRAITYTTNGITGPFWRQIEKSPIGEAAGKASDWLHENVGKKIRI
jgi:hypothetical protein